MKPRVAMLFVHIYSTLQNGQSDRRQTMGHPSSMPFSNTSTMAGGGPFTRDSVPPLDENYMDDLLEWLRKFVDKVGAENCLSTKIITDINTKIESKHLELLRRMLFHNFFYLFTVVVAFAAKISRSDRFNVCKANHHTRSLSVLFYCINLFTFFYYFSDLGGSFTQFGRHLSRSEKDPKIEKSETPLCIFRRKVQNIFTRAP